MSTDAGTVLETGVRIFQNQTICAKVLRKTKHGLLIYIVIYFQKNSMFTKTVLKKLFVYL